MTASGSGPTKMWLDCPEGALALQITASNAAGEGPRGNRIPSQPAAPAGQSPVAVFFSMLNPQTVQNEENFVFIMFKKYTNLWSFLILSSWPGDCDSVHHRHLHNNPNQPDVLQLCERKVIIIVRFAQNLIVLWKPFRRHDTQSHSESNV